MKSVINELWLGNINPQTDSRNNSPEKKELMEYMGLFSFLPWAYKGYRSQRNGEQ